MVQKENWEEICGDLHAVRIIGQTGGFPKSTKENLKRSLQCVLQKSKDFVIEAEALSSSVEKNQSSSEESPPKKRRIDAAQVNKTHQVVEEKTDSPDEPPTTTDAKDETTLVEAKEEVKSEGELKENLPEKPAATTTITPTAACSSSALVSTRNDLIKDIESHIEIIYECLDELNESGSTSSANKTVSIEPISATTETSSQEGDKPVKETTENSETKATDPPAQDESKNE